MSRDKLSKKIEKSQVDVARELRDYIGASVIGSECHRQIWYELNGTASEGVPPKTIRTWDIGKRLEGLVIEWLRGAGFDIEEKKATYTSLRVPILQGHVDCILNKKNNPCAIIEIKTAKDASFKVFVNKGAKAWNPQYYAQIQSYMGMSGIHSTYILVLNKDNSELSDELVAFDEAYYALLEMKALMISTSPVIPPKVNNSPIWYQCKICKFNKVCHG